MKGEKTQVEKGTDLVIRKLFCFSIAAILLCAGVALVQEKEKFTADRHKERGVSCEVCHGEAQPTKAASAEKCQACHQSLEAVAERTKDFVRDPHKNHITDSSDVECTRCHNGHKANSPVCNACHSGFKFEKKKDEAETK